MGYISIVHLSARAKCEKTSFVAVSAMIMRYGVLSPWPVLWKQFFADLHEQKRKAADGISAVTVCAAGRFAAERAVVGGSYRDGKRGAGNADAVDHRRDLREDHPQHRGERYRMLLRPGKIRGGLAFSARVWYTGSSLIRTPPAADLLCLSALFHSTAGAFLSRCPFYEPRTNREEKRWT